MKKRDFVWLTVLSMVSFSLHSEQVENVEVAPLQPTLEPEVSSLPMQPDCQPNEVQSHKIPLITTEQWQAPMLLKDAMVSSADNACAPRILVPTSHNPHSFVVLERHQGVRTLNDSPIDDTQPVANSVFAQTQIRLNFPEKNVNFPFHYEPIRIERGDTPVDLYTVVLHEIGHALGLSHTSPNDGVTTAMDPYYIVPLSGLSAADIAAIQALFPENGKLPSQGWQDFNGDGVILMTYSFVPDYTSVQGDQSSLFQGLNEQFGQASVWQDIIRSALKTWELATKLDNASDGNLNHNVELHFVEVTDAGFAFNYPGLSQGDAFSGDIRFSGIHIDGGSGTLAQAYYPPPNGSTGAGDIQLDSWENWQNLQEFAQNPDGFSPALQSTPQFLHDEYQIL